MIEDLSLPVHATPQLRLSLKRGFAAQAVADAGKVRVDHRVVFSDLCGIAPNRRATERAVSRLRKRAGVVRAGISEDAVVVTLREACDMLTRHDGVDAFREEVLIYTWVTVMNGKGMVRYRIHRASFSRHALERLIERSTCALGAGFLDTIDREAACALARIDHGNLIAHHDDDYLDARADGVWAGSMDLTAPDPDWGLTRDDACIPTFSARTFLGPDEMKPAVWLRWRDDPAMSMVA